MYRILLGTDFSDQARSAYGAAAALAREYDAKIWLVHSTSPVPPYGYEVVSVDFPKDSVYRLLAQRLSDEAQHPDLQGRNVETKLLYEGAPAASLVDFARAEKVDLIVVTTHGRTGLSRALLGSFAEKVLRLAPMPVLTYRRPEKGTIGQVWPRSVMVPFDYSKNAEAVLPWMRFLSERYGSHFTFLHVIEPRHRMFEHLPDQNLLDTLRAEDERRPLDAELHFGQLREEKFRDVEAHFKARSGSPWAEIVAEAQEENPDLILMSTHGRTGLSHFVLGSVAERVVRSAPCSVMTVRPASVHVEEPAPSKQKAVATRSE